MKNIDILDDDSPQLDEDDLSIEIEESMEESQRNVFREHGIKDKALGNFQRFKELNQTTKPQVSNRLTDQSNFILSNRSERDSLLSNRVTLG